MTKKIVIELKAIGNEVTADLDFKDLEELRKILNLFIKKYDYSIKTVEFANDVDTSDTDLNHHVVSISCEDNKANKKIQYKSLDEVDLNNFDPKRDLRLATHQDVLNYLCSEVDYDTPVYVPAMTNDMRTKYSVRFKSETGISEVQNMLLDIIKYGFLENKQFFIKDDSPSFYTGTAIISFIKKKKPDFDICQ